MLEIRALHAGYGNVEILRGIDLDVGSGEIVAVLGSNGVGKSTLNKNISALHRPVPASRIAVTSSGVNALMLATQALVGADAPGHD